MRPHTSKQTTSATPDLPDPVYVYPPPLRIRNKLPSFRAVTVSTPPSHMSTEVDEESLIGG